MKTCPICNAAAFDDASVCYGCMHRYDEQKDGDVPPKHNEEELGRRSSNSAGVSENDTPPAFFIKMTPSHDASGDITWSCSVVMDVC